MKLGIGNWVAIIGCIGLGVGAVVGAQGCTATLTVGPCDGGCVGPIDEGDSAAPPNQDSGPLADSAVADSATADATQVDAGSTPIDPCNACLYGQCVGQYSNCVADNAPTTGCLAIYQCATSAACVNDGGNCVQDCYNLGAASSKAIYLALGDCDQNAQCSGASPTGTCATTCGTTAASCPMVMDAGSDDAATDAATTDAGTCMSCQMTSCSAQLTACQAPSACASYNQCLLGCTTAACDTACTTDNPTGAQAATALGMCTASNCATPCQ